MATRKALVGALYALDAFAKGEPLRRAVSDAMASQDKLGPKERRFVAHTARETVQHLRRIDALLAQSGVELRKLIPEDRSLLRLLAVRLRLHGAPASIALRELGLPGPRRPRGAPDTLLAQAAAQMPLQLDPPQERVAALALEHSFPDWQLPLLLEGLPQAEHEPFLRAQGHTDGLDLRVNLLRAKPADVLAELAAAGLEVKPGRYLPECILAEDRALLFDLPAFKQGRVEVQDEASQLIARLCAPKNGERVLDACAGAGGKTLALGALARDADLWATDAIARRLEPLKRRALRGGVRVKVSDELPEGDFDLVLADAPCSGLGALAREPEAKWRLTREALDGYVASQAAILRKLAPKVKEGGRLVYATCSPLVREDMAQVEAFLRDVPGFRLQPARELMGDALADQLKLGDTLQLWSHRHGTGSFFAASLQRIPAGKSTRVRKPAAKASTKAPKAK